MADDHDPQWMEKRLRLDLDTAAGREAAKAMRIPFVRTATETYGFPV